MMLRRKMQFVMALGLAAVSLFLPTCISAEERDFLKYDAAKDEFQMLMVLQDIRVKDANDLDFLARVYENRDHLIAPAIPGAAEIFPLAAFSMVRLSDSKFAAINIFCTRPSSLDPIESGGMLDSIKIHPGTFFVQGKAVGYYQAISVPGKSVDAALEQALKNQDVMAPELQKEIDRRAGGGETATWEKATTYILNSTRKEFNAAIAGNATQPATEEAAIDPPSVFDVDSLKNLKQAVTDKKLKVRRDKAVLSLALPLTPKDIAGATDLFKRYGDLLDELVKTADTSKTALDAATLDKLHTLRGAAVLFHTIILTSDDKGLTISLDLVKYGEALATLQVSRVDLNTKPEPAPVPVDLNGKPEPAPAETKPVEVPAIDVADYLRKQGIPLDETLTADQIIKDFNAGTLKEFPSKTPVTPGKGIATSQPAN